MFGSRGSHAFKPFESKNAPNNYSSMAIIILMVAFLGVILSLSALIALLPWLRHGSTVDPLEIATTPSSTTNEVLDNYAHLLENPSTTYDPVDSEESVLPRPIITTEPYQEPSEDDVDFTNDGDNFDDDFFTDEEGSGEMLMPRTEKSDCPFTSLQIIQQSGVIDSKQVTWHPRQEPLSDGSTQEWDDAEEQTTPYKVFKYQVTNYRNRTFEISVFVQEDRAEELGEVEIVDERFKYGKVYDIGFLVFDDKEREALECQFIPYTYVPCIMPKASWLKTWLGYDDGLWAPLPKQC